MEVAQTVIVGVLIVAVFTFTLCMALWVIGAMLWWLNGDIYKRKYKIMKWRNRNGD